MEQITHHIGGEDVESASGATFDSVDPYTRSAYAQVALGGRVEVDRAVAAARQAYDEGPWPRMGLAERGALLHRLADLVVEHTDELALADTVDMGKPVTDARTKDVPRTAQNLRFFADHARLSTGETYPMDSGHHAYSVFQPVGVVAAISPWNFPLMLESWKVAPALAWGNTVVLKPAEDTPKSGTLLARLATEAGLPPGVLNVVHGFGPDSAGAALTEHPGVDRITFTGESGTGRVIGQAAAARLTPVSFELGGKGANLVFDDADLDNAVSWSVKAIFSNAGQVCLAGSRLFVQRAAYDEFVARFVAAAEALRIGDPKDPATELGPLASEEHWKKVTGYLDDVSAGTGTMLTGGPADGWFIRPTVVVDAPLDSRLKVPPSRPTPESPTPPNGARRSRMKKQLTQTVPARRAAETRCARERFSVKTIALSPYGESLASRTPSSSVSKGWIVTSGPNTSSQTSRESSGASTTTVGRMNQPSAGPPVSIVPVPAETSSR